MTVVLAHAADWIVNLVFLLPVLVTFVWIAVRTLLDRRGREPAEHDRDESP